MSTGRKLALKPRRWRTEVLVLLLYSCIGCGMNRRHTWSILYMCQCYWPPTITRGASKRFSQRRSPDAAQCSGCCRLAPAPAAGPAQPSVRAAQLRSLCFQRGQRQPPCPSTASLHKASRLLGVKTLQHVRQAGTAKALQPWKTPQSRSAWETSVVLLARRLPSIGALAGRPIPAAYPLRVSTYSPHLAFHLADRRTLARRKRY